MEEENKGLKLNQEYMDVLVANVIPTTKYFESRFDHMQYQIDEIKNGQIKMQEDIDARFEKVDARFDSMQKDMDARFDKVDKRFEQVDARFERVERSINDLSMKIEKLTAAQETTIRDYIIERDRFYDKKFANLRMYNIAIIALVSGVILKMAGIIQF